MVDEVLDHIAEPALVDSFQYNSRKLHDYFLQKFDPIRDHTSFFFPGTFLPE